jgi:hypothetical protein
MKGIDLLASDTEHKRIISIQVKTKTAGTWQTSIKHGKKQTKPDEVKQFWIFVDLGPEQPGYYVVPDWWIENDIDKEHKKYLKVAPGKRSPQLSALLGGQFRRRASSRTICR